MSFYQMLPRERATRRRIQTIVTTCFFIYIMYVMTMTLTSIISKKEATYLEGENISFISGSPNLSEVNAAVFLHVGCRFQRGTQSAVIDMMKAIKKLKHVPGVEFFYTRSDGELDSLSRSLLSKNGFQEAKPSDFFTQLAKQRSPKSGTSRRLTHDAFPFSIRHC